MDLKFNVAELNRQAENMKRMEVGLSDAAEKLEAIFRSLDESLLDEDMTRPELILISGIAIDLYHGLRSTAGRLVSAAEEYSRMERRAVEINEALPKSLIEPEGIWNLPLATHLSVPVHTSILMSDGLLVEDWFKELIVSMTEKG